MHALVKKDILTTMLGSGCRCASSYWQRTCKAEVETTAWSAQLLFRRRRDRLATSCLHLDIYCARSWGTLFGFMNLDAASAGCVPGLKQVSSLNDSACRVQDPADFEYHSCPCGRYCWPPTPRRQWAQHANDVCPCCQDEDQDQPRFKRHRETKHLAPRQVGFLAQAPLCGHLSCPTSNLPSACRCSMPSLARMLCRALPPSQSFSGTCASTGTGVQPATLGALMPSALMHSLRGSCWELRASRSQPSWNGAACTTQLTTPRASCASGAGHLGCSVVQACTHRSSAARRFMCR